MRNRIASLLHRWAYRIKGHRAEHRAGGNTSFGTWITAGGGKGGLPPERRESRGWN